MAGRVFPFVHMQTHPYPSLPPKGIVKVTVRHDIVLGNVIT